MRFAVIGTGGIGGYFGGRLAAGGHDVGFLARGAHLDALRGGGLQVRSVAGDFIVPEVSATDDTADIGVVDVVLMCVKTWQLRPALAALPPLMGPDTVVITFQNGVEAPAEVADAVGRDAVLPGTAKIIAHIDGPGGVRHLGGPALLAFAEWDGRPSERADRIRAAMREAGIAVAEPADIWAELWSKAVHIVPFGGLGAVTDAPFGVLRSRPGTRAILADAMAEVRDVAAALGTELGESIVDDALAFIDAQPAEGTTSLQRDILAGRPSELEAWTGAVVRLGAKAGVQTPVNGLFYEVLAAREAARRNGP